MSRVNEEYEKMEKIVKDIRKARELLKHLARTNADVTEADALLSYSLHGLREVQNVFKDIP